MLKTLLTHALFFEHMFVVIKNTMFNSTLGKNLNWTLPEIFYNLFEPAGVNTAVMIFEQADG